MNKNHLTKEEKNVSSQPEEIFLIQSSDGNVENQLSLCESDKQTDDKIFYPLEGEAGYDLDNNEIVNISNEEVEKNISIQKKKLDEIEQSVSKQSSKKSKIINIVFFIVNLVVVGGILTYQLLTQEFTPITNLTIDIKSLIMIVVLMFLVVFIETFLISYLVKQSTGKWRFGLAYKVANIGRYYDAVTPMSTGGQPFQISYLKSRGVPIHTSLSIPLSKYVFSQIAWAIISLTCLIVSWVDTSYGSFVSIMSIVGFVLTFLVLAVIIFLSCCKTVGKKIVVKVLKLLNKMKIVKNYEKQYEKLTKSVSDFQDVMKQYAKSPKDFIVMVVASLIKIVIGYSRPFFIVKLFIPGLGWDMYFKLFVMACLVELSSSFFPLPGGTGMSEISFTAAFGAVVSQMDVLVWVLLLWRFCTYYYWLLQGVCVLSYDMAYGNRKYRWQVRKNHLAEESFVFKQEQINRFRSDRAKRRKIKNNND